MSYTDCMAPFQTRSDVPSHLFERQTSFTSSKSRDVLCVIWLINMKGEKGRRSDYTGEILYYADGDCVAYIHVNKDQVRREYILVVDPLTRFSSL